MRVARTRQGITRREISKRTGLNENVITALEMGRSDSKILTYKRIIDALSMEMKDFL